VSARRLVTDLEHYRRWPAEPRSDGKSLPTIQLRFVCTKSDGLWKDDLIMENIRRGYVGRETCVNHRGLPGAEQSCLADLLVDERDSGQVHPCSDGCDSGRAGLCAKPRET